MRRTTILSVACDPSVLSTRNLVLEQAGHSVQGAKNFCEAINIFARISFDLVILCHSIPKTQKNDMAKSMRLLRPETRLLMLYTGEEQPNPSVDAQLSNLNPEALLDAVAALIRKTELHESPVKPESSLGLEDCVGEFF